MLATQVQLSADQLYAVGMGDGLSSRPQDRNYRASLDYSMGYVAGQRTRPDAMVNVERAPESHLERGWGDELLNPITAERGSGR